MNKQDHILNGIIVGIGVGIIFAAVGDGTLVPDREISTLTIVVGVTVPVTLGALVPDIDTAFGRHRKTLHNLLVLGGFIAFPLVFDNLRYVWIGVLTHYLLDLLGSKRGIALWYPLSADEYNPSIGVAGSNSYTSLITLLISGFELVVGYAVIYTVLQAGISLRPLLP